jgi:O-antigen biosynthesis protein
MTSPEISFVIPSYNYGRFLKDCIDSVLNQEGGFDFEIIVVDDASKDNSTDIIRSYSDPRIRPFFHDVNQGHVVTINEGFAAARGRYIARIDSDDRYRSNFLSEAMPRLRSNPKIGLVYADIAMIDAEGRFLGEPSGRLHHGKETVSDEFLSLLSKNHIPAATVIGTREAWQKALPIPQGLGFSDWYLSLKIARHFRLCYIPKILADYRVHDKNLHYSIIFDKSQEKTTMRLLDEFFSQETEPRILNAKNKTYASHYLDLADKYFYCRMDADARRCYWAAFRLCRRYGLTFDWQRRYFATWIGRRPYEGLKILCGKGPVRNSV